MGQLWLPAGTATAATGSGLTLERVSAALGASPCWQVDFTQRYVPAGFETGASESGALTLSPPASLRFDYAGPQPRVFAADGAVARWLDFGAQTCTAIRIDATTWGRMPLTAFLDPGAARAAFSIAVAGSTMTLTAREPTPELASVVVEVRPDALPAAVTVVDGAGNRNEFTFATWTGRGEPGAGFYRPVLGTTAPCEPAEE